jgi:hypothetical protein
MTLTTTMSTTRHRSDRVRRDGEMVLVTVPA